MLLASALAFACLQQSSKKPWIWVERRPDAACEELAKVPTKPWVWVETPPGPAWRSQPAPTSGFGDRIVILDDVDCDGVPDLAISAPLDDPNGTESGSVFVVSGRDGHLLRRFPGSEPDERFGRFLASAPDLDRDGVPDLLAGGRGPVRALSVGTGEVLREFVNASAAIAMDLDGDGVPDWVLGSPLFIEPDSGLHRGAVGAFSGRDGRLLFRVPGEIPTRDVAGFETLSSFGEQLVGLGDLDGDGLPDFAVGASGSGSIRICSGRDGSTLRSIVGSPSRGDGGLGWRLARATDVDGDGVEDLLASTWDDGSVQVISSRSGARVGTLRHQRPGFYLEGFGSSMACAGDLDDDGRPDYAVGCSEFTEDLGDDYCIELYSGAEGWLIGVYDTDSNSASVGEGRDFDLDGIPDLPVGLPELDEVVILAGNQFGARPVPSMVGRSEWWETLVIRRDGFP